MATFPLRRLFTALLLVLALVVVPTRPAPAAPAHQAHTVTFDKYSLMVDGRRLYVWAGEFHYWRLPSPDLWRDVLQKMKAAGYNAATIYFDWGYHSPAPGRYDFTGVRDVDRLLDIAAQVGIYVIARQGPYINAETDGGGFPGWLNRMAVKERTADPAYLRHADEWLTRIDTIIARHQVTNGTGTVLLDQVENEYYDGSAAGRAYMAHLEAKYHADGITVPLTGNHNGTFETGDGALDIDGWDSYPQGFDCSNPSVWHGVPDYSAQRASLTDRPLYFPEYQGGAFDPWGGAGYDRCRQLTDADFEKVFYDTNIGVGSTMQSFYMTYGGTSWGFLPFPGVYTSYDYGAAIAEDRELTTKYAQQKLTGYLLASVPELAQTDLMAAPAPDDPALWLKARVNPTDGTQLYVLRHADGTSTASDSTHLSLDLSGRTGYSYDDNDPALRYTGTGWAHATGQNGDYGATESWDDTAGDALTVSFHGTAIRWIAPRDGNHGITDVALDGTHVASVDGYAPTKQYQPVLYSLSGLPDTDHTLTLTVTGSRNPAASGTFTTVDAIDVPPPAGADYYPSVPQQPGTAIAVDGRDAKLLLANHALGDQHLAYSTSQLMTQATTGDTDVALFHDPAGESGETVLRYSSRPTVTVLSGAATTTWDAARGDLRLNYVHKGLTRVLVHGGGHRDLELLLADDTTAEQFWREDTSAGPVLVQGPELVRTASVSRGTLALTGDTAATTPLSVWAPPSIRSVTWNGRSVRGGTLPGPRSATLPRLSWRSRPGTPEAEPGYDDSGWTLADHGTTDNPTGVADVPVLYADDYGFHAGDVWYRGHFGGATATGVTLAANTGNSTGIYSVWVNGNYLGSASGGHSFPFPAGTLHDGADNVVSVLVENMGHDEGTGMAPRGLTSARLAGTTATLTWRIQGDRGGEDLIDPVRGPLNTGGLSGERAGWTLPGYPDRGWPSATLPAASSTPGVTWYRSTFEASLPKDQDVPVALRFADDPAKKYRVQIYLNGWNLGLYVNDVGPQHDFPLPAGLLDTRGHNTLALAVWSEDAASGLGAVSLVAQANLRGGVPVSTVDSPRYDPRRYAQPASPGQVTVSAPDTIERGGTATVTATVAVPKGRPAVRSASVTLGVPDGWRVAGPATVALGRIPSGGSARASWQVTAPTGDQPWGAVLTATATLDGRTVVGGHTVNVPPPPPHGTVYASDLPFQSTNGWGPVERDTSNGEAVAGDGRPITLNGTVYPKGLGVHADGDVTVATGGQCTRFTAVVGVDDEVGASGSVTFTVLADGRAVVATGVLTGSSASVPLDVDVSGAQRVDLLIGDAGNGNGSDHADWADAQLICS
jgi:beta-galactosidase GanA